MENWPAFSTTEGVNIHGILVTFSRMRENPLDVSGFINAVEGAQNQNLKYVSLKCFYENVSRGHLRFGNITAEKFFLNGEIIDDEKAYEQYFKYVLDSGRMFKERTHFMFGFDKTGASAEHSSYKLNFSSRMLNESSLIHEFGHNLGLYHATTPDNDRGDLSDRMGAKEGCIEFNAPNLIFLRWLDAESVVTVKQSGDYSITSLEFSNPTKEVPRVVMIPISSNNFLYLSFRKQIGPYDSYFLDSKYAGAMSIHTRGLDNSGIPKKTQLLSILRDNECFRLEDRNLLQNYQSIDVSIIQILGCNLHFRQRIQ